MFRLDSITPFGNPVVPDVINMSAALKAATAVDRTREVIAIELLCACQAIDLLAPLTTSAPLVRVHALVRSRVPTLERDRAPSPDIAVAANLIATGAVETACATRVK